MARKKNPATFYVNELLKSLERMLPIWNDVMEVSVTHISSDHAELYFTCIVENSRWRLVGKQDDDDDTQYTLYRWVWDPHPRTTGMWELVGSWSSAHPLKEIVLRGIKPTYQNRIKMEEVKIRELDNTLAEYVPCIRTMHAEEEEILPSRKGYLSRAPEASIGAGIVIAGIAGFLLGKK